MRKEHKTMKHTPTPWKVIDGKMIIGDSYKEPVIGTINPLTGTDAQDYANAAFICKAVNSHEALLNACKDARAFIQKYVPNADVSWLNGAINKAGAL